MGIITWLFGWLSSDEQDHGIDVRDLIEDAIESEITIWVEVLIGCHYKIAHPDQVNWLISRMPSFDPERLNEDAIVVYEQLYLIGDDRLDLLRKVRSGLGPMSSWNKETLTKLFENLRSEQGVQQTEHSKG